MAASRRREAQVGNMNTVPTSRIEQQRIETAELYI